MRWRTPSEQTQLAMLLPVLIPLVGFLAPVGLMMWGFVKANELLFPQRDWHPWFAWRPIRIFDWDDFRGEWFWLEIIERKRLWHGGDCSYRRAIAAGSRRAKTPQAVECEASQSGAESASPTPSSHSGEA